MLDKKTLCQQLAKLGIQPGMELLVHSSLRKLGPVDGGADTIIDCLLELLGKSGTLLLSTVSGSVNPQQPVYHVKYTPASVGTLPNIFRQRSGVIRSLHPVHSVAAIGAEAEFFCTGHLQSRTPWSPDSPYGKLLRRPNGNILFLGTNFASNTCLHALEIEARVPGLHTEHSSTLQVCDCQNNWHQVQHHWHAPKKDNYVDMEHWVAIAGGLQYGVVGNSISRLSNTVKLRECLLPVLQQNPELVIQRLSDNDFIWE